MRLLRRHICVIAAVLVAGCTSVATKPGGDTPPPGWSAHNVELLGYTAMKGNSAFKITMTRAGDRWYIIGGHYNTPGWSVVDVTDPRHPFVAKFIPGPTNTSTNQVVSADGILVASLGRPNEREDAGMTAKKPYSAGIMLIDIKDPLNPKELGRWYTDKPQGRGTHRNMYEGGRYVHLAADMNGYDGDIYVILDISNPAKPVEAGRWWVPGQHVAGGEKPQRDPNVNLHNPNFVDGNLAYLSYGDAGMVILDISDVAKPKFVSATKFEPKHRFDAHTVLPWLSAKRVIVNSEAVTYNCKGPLDHVTIVDVSDPAKPVPTITLPGTRTAAGCTLHELLRQRRALRPAQSESAPAYPGGGEAGEPVVCDVVQRGITRLRCLGRAAAARGRLLHGGPATEADSQGLRPLRAHGRCPRRHTRLHVRDGRGAAGPVYSSLHWTEEVAGEIEDWRLNSAMPATIYRR